MKLRLLGATIIFAQATIRIMNICYKKSLILGVSGKARRAHELGSGGHGSLPVITAVCKQD